MTDASKTHSRVPTVLVLGAGVVGLSTALRVLQEIPEVQLTVVADKFLQETTSYGPAGMFRPTLGLTNVASRETYRKWCTDSFRWFHELNTSLDPAETGIIRVSGYQFSDVTEFPLHHDMCYHFRELTSRELEALPGNFRYGWFYTTLMMEDRRYMPWLTDRIKRLGGQFQRKKINDLRELTGTCDVVVNCAGLENHWLTDDPDVFPVRGHLIRVAAPWVRHFYVFDGGDSYIYPGQNDVVLGGTRQKGEWNTSMTSASWFSDITDRCAKLLPGLKDAPVTSRWIGLRPHRTTMRVEPETIQHGQETLHVVHNYGHGANGVALSWGTAVEACSLVQKALTSGQERFSTQKCISKL